MQKYSPDSIRVVGLISTSNGVSKKDMVLRQKFNSLIHYLIRLVFNPLVGMYSQLDSAGSLHVSGSI